MGEGLGGVEGGKCICKVRPGGGGGGLGVYLGYFLLGMCLWRLRVPTPL